MKVNFGKQEHVELDTLKEWKLNILNVTDKRIIFFYPTLTPATPYPQRKKQIITSKP